MSGGFSVVRTYNGSYNTCDLKKNTKNNVAKKKVAILMGSSNDKDKMKGAVESLELFGIDTDVHVLSAHRQPSEVCDLATHARQNGYSAFVCGAGKSLAGVVSAHTTLPVVGVPLSGSALSGLDALYSTVQMPKGIPVATVANAGILIAQMLGM